MYRLLDQMESTRATDEVFYAYGWHKMLDKKIEPIDRVYMPIRREIGRAEEEKILNSEINCMVTGILV